MTSPAMSVDKLAATKDSDWVKASFMLAVNRWDAKKGRLQQKNKDWLYFTSANYKLGNTSLGGNYCLNSLAQFTHFCDIPRGGLDLTKMAGDTVGDASMGGGMGRYYSESIDDWSQKVSFRFGVPEYKGLITFFTNFYDSGAALLGRQGRLFAGLFYTGAKIVMSLIALPLTVAIWVGEAVQWLMNRPTSRYYNLKPAMALYWQRVNLIANMMAANMGIVPKERTNADDEAANMDPFYDKKNGSLKGSYAFDQFRQHYPRMFMEHGGIDIYYVATKFTRMNMKRTEELRALLGNRRGDWSKNLKADVDKHIKNFTFTDKAIPGKSLNRYLQLYHQNRFGFADPDDPDFNGNDPVSKMIADKMQKTADGNPDAQTSTNTIEGANNDATLSEGAQGQEVPPAGDATGELPVDPATQALMDDADKDSLLWPIVVEDETSDGTALGSVFKKIGGWAGAYKDYAKEIAQDGGQWINFRVDTVKTVDESFTNNVGPSEIEGKINGMSSSAAAFRFGASDLKTGVGIVDEIVGTIRNTLIGVADGLHLGGLAALMGSGFVDIPQRWMDSSASMPSATYTIKCRPPYGNIMSRFLNMHVPIACLLAAALPISYGRHSYGAPMICEFYVQGKNQSRLAMITSLSITRGEGNLGWTKDGEFLGCDITFEVTDLSSVMHAPIDSGMQDIGAMRWMISDDNVFNDYMSVLSNLSIGEMTYSWEKLKLNFKKYMVTQQNFMAPNRIAMAAGDSGLGRFIRKVSPNSNPTTA